MPVPSRRAATTFALAALLLLLLPATARATAQPAAPVYTLRNARTGSCLHHVFGTAQVRLEPCEAVPEQRWELRVEGAWINLAAFDPEKDTRGCVAIGDSWIVNYGQCRVTEAAWSVTGGGHCRFRSGSDLSDDDLYLVETQAGDLGARPDGTTPSADWLVTEAS
ncbi:MULTISPECIES: hypothetical protein [Kitasatospora]|uniref:Ricin B lectin domain-containing protein n=1 Tax=Kitasatospora cathayae TaxID=3004092 RepID=A0ABY7QEF9_9ACTN|nr:hypothetical protein [Kitasatospora sp. HUAS 3-15]WBP91012.1 hypothetical protein O1G21_37525 [Kitasatospora sp. HUAS 3-15]